MLINVDDRCDRGDDASMCCISCDDDCGHDADDRWCFCVITSHHVINMPPMHAINMPPMRSLPSLSHFDAGYDWFHDDAVHAADDAACVSVDGVAIVAAAATATVVATANVDDVMIDDDNYCLRPSMSVTMKALMGGDP